MSGLSRILEESGRGLFRYTIPVLRWRNWGAQKCSRQFGENSNPVTFRMSFKREKLFGSTFNFGLKDRLRSCNMAKSGAHNDK